jgi:ribosomal protein L32
VQGLSAHYARLLTRNDINLIGEVINSKSCPRLGNKARLACKWVEKNLLQVTDDFEMVMQEWNLSKEGFGIYKEDINIDLTMSLPARVIRNGWMALKHEIDKPIDLCYKYPTIIANDQPDKERIALQKIAKIRSIRLRNNILRILNGDVFSKERMHRFAMIEEDKCDRCGEVETRNHLLFNCGDTNKMWQLFANIHQRVTGRSFNITERNMLACGDNYNSLATTTIIAELIKTNVLYRSKYRNDEELMVFIKPIIQREVSWYKSQKNRIQTSWVKWVNFLTLVDVDGGPGVTRDPVVEDLDQLPAPIGEVERDEDLQPAPPVPVVNVPVRLPDPVP